MTTTKTPEPVHLANWVDSFYYQIDDGINPFLNKRPGQDAGYDLYALEDTWLAPFQTKSLKTNAHIHIPTGHLGRVTCRSGHAKRGWLTHPGTVDSGYTGNIGVIQTNLSLLPRKIKRGERVAQLIFMPFSAAELRRVYSLHDYETKVRVSTNSNRGKNSYNSSGTM